MIASFQGSAAAVGNLLLALTAVVAVLGNSPMGLPVAVVSRSGYPPGALCVEQRLVIVRMTRDRNLYIHSEPVTRIGLIQRLEELFRTRAERVAFVVGDPELEYGDVVDLVAQVRSVVPNIGLLTPASIPTLQEPILKGHFPLRAEVLPTLR